MNKFFTVDKFPYLLTLLFAVFAWVFNNWINDLNSEPRIIYSYKTQKKDTVKQINYEIINISDNVYNELKLAVCNMSNNSEDFIIKDAYLKFNLPEYQQNIMADIDGSCANYTIKKLNPKTKWNLNLIYAGSIKPELFFISIKENKPIIITKKNMVNVLIYRSNVVNISILIILLIMIIIYTISYGKSFKN